MTSSAGKKLLALNLANSETPAGKLVWLVESDRKNISIIRKQKANAQPLHVHSDTIVRKP